MTNNHYDLFKYGVVARSKAVNLTSTMFDVNKVIDGLNGLEIYIIDEATSQEQVITFPEYHGYRSFDETDLFCRFESMNIKGCGLYYFKDSEFIDWANAQTIHDKIHPDILHYVLVSINDVIDILSWCDPKITS